MKIKQEIINKKWDDHWKRENIKLKNFFAHRVFLDSWPVYQQYIISSEKNINLLEVGSGSGRYGLKLASEYPNFNITMTDIVDTAVRLIGQRVDFLKLKNVEVIKADAKNLPFADNSFDIVFSDAAIQYFPDYSIAVEEMERVLKPGGRLILSVVNWWNLPHTIYKKIINDNFVWGYEKSFTIDELRELLTSFGLKIVGEDGFSPAYGIYRLKYHSVLFKYLGQVFSRLIKIIDRFSGRFVSRYFGFQIIIIAEK